MTPKQDRPPAGVGLVSLFTVLMVLCVAVFSVLSLVSSRSDYRLSQRNGETVAAYYAADSRAAEVCAYVQDVLWPAGAQRPTAEQMVKSIRSVFSLDSTVRAEGASYTVSFPLAVDESRTMNVTLFCARGGFCVPRDRSLHTVPESIPLENEPLPVWQGS